ncbi:AI-2E family transporter [Fervidibacillus halotolerans]|uniref:AI-2E family transporter n=1 Tax=Fervidibacillus halotolerans TaxID=2980027 RepID=A0A9E8LY91_9BACI|nr:AI-2E family transporter [Fervidibacillus halotolerans]WAA11922.1 AI-2E family transporter [Fervidibacillus halotolerans]
MQKSKVQFWTLEILMIVGIIYISTKISFLFEPIFVFVSTLFFPILISGFLYFILNPIVTFANKYKVPRTVGILILYVLFIGLITLVSALVGPYLARQISDLINNIPNYFNQLKDFVTELSRSPFFEWVQTQNYVTIDKIEETVTNYVSGISKAFTSSLSGVFNVVTNITLVIATVPFLLFYMLKDGHKLPNAIVRFLPTSYRNEGLTILKDMNKTLASYIQGQLLVSLSVGTLATIGYFIIDLPYALVLGIIVAVTNIIPYLGPFLGAAPAVIIGLFDSPLLAMWAVVVVVIAQQIDSNLLSPLIIGKQLDTHPATIIILLLVAGNLAGILGMILAVPVYAVSKTLVINLVRLYRLHRKHQLEERIE